MSTRGNFEAALRSVQAFESWEGVERSGREGAGKSSKRDSCGHNAKPPKKRKKGHNEREKEKSSRKHTDGKKRKSKKKSKAKGSRKHHRRLSESDSDDVSSSDGSSSDGEGGNDKARGNPSRWSSATRLERGQAAVRVTRELMARHPGIQAELRELLRQLDGGEGVDVSGVQEADLRQRLGLLFWNLPLTKIKGAYKKLPGGESLLGGVLGTVLQEKVAPINTDANEGEKAGSKVPIAEERQQPHEPSPPSEALNQKPGERAGDEDDEWLVEPDDPDIGKSEDMEAKLGGLRPIGPAMPPGMAASHGAFPEEENTGTAEEAGHGEHARPGRVGPVMPSREMLEAAARAAEAYDWEEEAEEEDWDLIGPPPLEIVLDIESAGDDARALEVVRIMQEVSAVASEGKEVDAYKVLGVPREANKGEVKKRYWKLSLLIHPDKCSHPKAQPAFAALNEAAKTLQDESGRARLDERLEDEQLMKMAVEEAKQQQRAADWARVRGGGSAADASLPAGPQKREGWMTDLPPERQVKAGVSVEGMVTSFSQHGNQGRGDTSAWTDTPANRAERARAGPTMALPSAESVAAMQRQGHVASLVDSYNMQNRAKSLLELHQEKIDQEKKDKKRKKKEPKTQEKASAGTGSVTPLAEGEDWEGKHPWRPFDREKDLGPGLKSKDAKDLLKSAGTLSSRFGSGAGRSFL